LTSNNTNLYSPVSPEKSIVPIVTVLIAWPIADANGNKLADVCLLLLYGGFYDLILNGYCCRPGKITP